VVLGTGLYSVACFFVISGFLITRLSVRRWGEPSRISASAFYALRAARILPLLFVVVAASSLLHLLDVGPFVIRPEIGPLWRAICAALGFHVNWYEGRHGYLPGNWDVMWSLSVEETFYLLFPLVCLALRRPAAFLPVFLALIAIAPFYRLALVGMEPWDDYAYLSCMDAIAMGCIAGWLSERWPLDVRAGRFVFALGLAAVLLIVVFRKTTRLLGIPATGTNLTVLGAGMASMLFAMGSGTGKTAFARGTGLLRAIGSCSYEIYLTHMFVVFGFFIALRAVMGEKVPPQWFYPAGYAVILVLSVAVGNAISRGFSAPVNRALRTWLGRHVPFTLPASAGGVPPPPPQVR
jgi:peptidoglycan/LPS O-acetylase OafA/YrhL